MKTNQPHQLTVEIVEKAFQRAAASVVRTAMTTGTPIIVAVKGKAKKRQFQKYVHLLGKRTK